MLETLPFSVLLILILLLAILLRPNTQRATKYIEPPLISSAVPMIGHLIAFAYYGLGYFPLQSTKTTQPVFSIKILFQKVYIITSPRLVSAVQRSYRTMSFDPLITRTARCVGGITGPGLQLIREKASQGQGLGHHTTATMRHTLMGEGLDQMNKKIIPCLQKSVQNLKDHRGGLDLLQWCRLTLTIATTEAVYGSLNPYRCVIAREAFWEIEKNLNALMMDIAPWLFARKAWMGREYLANAFMEYFKESGHLESSQMVYTRWKTQHDAGATLEDIARLEIVMGLGILSNTVPTCFWVIFDIFSRPDLLKELREQIQQTSLSVDCDGLHTVDMAAVQDNCPLLLASLQETLRVRSNSAQLRVVHRETVLDESWLITAGSVLVIPAALINKSESVWGPNANGFNPQRFMTEVPKKNKESAFLSFGLSPNMCAGRHLATGEIIALTVMLILQFDICPCEGTWKMPPMNVKALAASLSPPADQYSVTIKEREQFKGAKWNFVVAPGMGRQNLIVG
ncbi:cytochrome P450 [Aspergillus caelatus]|uniref:Cytochrome P450 n=1 Tax=Aspergillus caelatus TaxID=61420 RepID=A0A5N6ZSR1_9EURO|nr:cytochrome P450 [Aspergillus caelatus]KAE8359939.1 cytochrome P450 [Aspergillus caelatus]